MNQRTVVVLGGSGFVGRHVVARLASASHRVVIPTRSRERARHLILLPTVDVVEADVHDEATLSRLTRGADAAVNLVGILHERKRGDFDRVHIELARKLADACRTS
ncbi:MAG: NAD-dependent epimerase/dehydratase family protein, partial [Betaproteobacteria bacterium]